MDTISIKRSKLCDQLGKVEAQIAELKKLQDLLKQELIARGPGAYEGSLFRSVVTVGEQHRLDMDAVRTKLSPQFIAANTFTVEVVRVSTKARNNVELKAA